MTNLANNMAKANYRATMALPSLGDGNIFNAWYNMDKAMRERHEAQEAIKKQNAWDEMMARNPYGNGNIQQTMPQFDIGEGIVADRNGWRGTPQQQTTNPFGIDTSGWGNPSGNSINVGSFDTPKQNAWTTAFGGVKSFNQPPTDNPQAQAVEGQQISPNYMSLMSNGQMTPQQQQEFDDKMNLRQWIEWDAKMNGVTNPLVSAKRYSIFVEPLRKQAEVNDLRNAYLTLQNPKSTDEEKMNAIALIEYDKKNPYMNEDHDMNVEKFGWARQNQENQQALFPYKLENAQLGLEGKRLALENSKYNTALNNLQILGDYGSQNLEGSKWIRKDGVDLSNMQPQAIAGINHMADIYYQMTGEPILITSGKDSNVHVGGKFSHYNGFKVDVATDKLEKDPALRQAFINECAKYGIMIGDEYTHPSPGSTGGHLDLQFAGYKGNYTNNRNRNSQTNVGYSPTLFNFNEFQDARKAFAESPNATTATALARGYAPDYIEFAKKDGAEKAKQKLFDKLMKDSGVGGVLNDEGKEDLVRTIVNEAEKFALFNVKDWNNVKPVQGTTNTKSSEPEKKQDPVDDLNREDQQGGIYNIGGTRMNESMYNKIKKIQQYEKTQEKEKKRFAAQREAAENRQRYNEDEWGRMFDENEKYYGV